MGDGRGEMGDGAFDLDAFGFLRVLFKDILCNFTSELGGEVWVVDADGSGNGFLTVISRDGDMTEGIVVIVDSLNGAVDLHRGLLLTRPLTFKGKLCRQLSQTVVVEDLPEVQGLGLDSALELSGGIHGALYIHLSSTRLYQRL